MRRLALIAMSLPCVVLVSLCPAVEIYVAPDGSDANPGTKDKPLASLEAARDAVRKLTGRTEPKAPAGQPATATGPITVILRGGTYCVTRTLELDKRDSGAADAPIVYRAQAGEKPLLLGGREIRSWRPGKGQLVQASLDPKDWPHPDFHQLICNGRRLPLARYPNADPSNPVGGGWAYVDGKVSGMYGDRPEDSRRELIFKEADRRGWANPAEGELFIFARHNWWNDLLPIVSVDPARRVLTVKRDASYAIRPGDRYFVQGLREELDSPGEWHLDRKAGLLTWWPDTPIQKAVIHAPTVQTILRVREATCVRFEGLTFECCDGSALVLDRCTDSVVSGCTFRNVGWFHGSAASLQNGARCGVVGCDFGQIGSMAISMSGGDRPTLTGGSHYADNNYIHHVGVYYKQGVGVAMNGVGHRASHNLIHDCPRFAVMFSGNNLVIEYNHCRHLSLETEDTGAFYTGGRDWISSRGTVIRYNFIHDVLGFGRDAKGNWVSPYFAWGVYLDDNAGGVDVIGNIIARAYRAGIHLHNGRDNLIQNNILVDNALQQFECNGWTDKHPYWTTHLPSMIKGYESVVNQPAWKNMRNMDIHPSKAVLSDGKIMTGNRFVKNIVYWHKPGAKLFSLRTVPFDHFESDQNVFFHFGLPLAINALTAKTDAGQWDEWIKMGFEKHSVVADPLFVDADKDDYRLRPDSPALKLGFGPIPVEKIGPYKDPRRASWPIVEAQGVRERPVR